MKFWGKVRKNIQRGKDLGFPTANVRLSKSIPEGIYVSKTRIKNIWHKSATFIGAAKTFGETRFHAEIYILDFNESLYGKWISVELIKKIRDNKRFDSAKDLIKQMKKDEKEARKYFTKFPID